VIFVCDINKALDADDRALGVFPDLKTAAGAVSAKTTAFLLELRKNGQLGKRDRREYGRRYRKANAEKMVAKRHKRRARILSVPYVEHTPPMPSG
jgi:hypothetical protein